MAPPKQSRYGEDYWFKRSGSSERTQRITAALSIDELNQILSCLKPGQTKSEWLREAIAQYLKNLSALSNNSDSNTLNQ